MNIPFNHECFDWEFSTERGGKGTRFQFEITEEGFGWRDLNTLTFSLWEVSLQCIEEGIKQGWYKVGKVPSKYYGPPENPIIVKIKLMERRHKAYLEKKKETLIAEKISKEKIKKKISTSSQPSFIGPTL